MNSWEGFDVPGMSPEQPTPVAGFRFGSDHALSPPPGVDYGQAAEALPLGADLVPLAEANLPGQPGEGDAAGQNDHQDEVRIPDDASSELPVRAVDGPVDIPPIDPPITGLPAEGDPNHDRAMAVRDACVTSARLQISDFFNYFQERPQLELQQPLRQLIGEVAKADIAASNLDSAEDAIGLLAATGQGHEVVPEVCVPAIEAGSDKARIVLQRQLKTEQEAQKTAISAAADNVAGKQYVPRSPALEQTLKAFAALPQNEQSQDGEEWIELFAASPEQAVVLTMKYHHDLVQTTEDPDELPLREAQYMMALREFIHGDQLSDGYVFTAGPKLLAETENLVGRLAIIRRYLSCNAEPIISTVLNNFDKLSRMGVEVVNDAELASPERVEIFGELIENHYEQIARAGMATYDTVHHHARWKIARAHQQGADSQQLLEIIDTQTSRLLSEPEGTERAMIDRNLSLQRYAIRYAGAGKFADARRLVLEISVPQHQSAAMADCLDLAESFGDALLLLPSKKFQYATFNPYLQIHFDFAELNLMDGDPDELHAFAMRCANEFRNPGNDWVSMLAYVDRSFELATGMGAEHATRMARGALAALRERVVPTEQLRRMSKWLTDHGDVREAEEAQQYILRHFSDNHSRRALELWRLAEQLKSFGTA